MPRKTPPRQDVDLESLIAHIQRINPTGKGLHRSEERTRYAEKAKLQSLLVENHPHDVRVRVHHDMPGVVSLSIPRLHASAGHAVVESLSSAARHWIELECRSEHDEPRFSRTTGRSRQPRASSSFIEQAEHHLHEYDFECAIQTLEQGAEDSRVDNDERIRALLLLLEIHVDHLANDDAALAIEPALRACGGLSERAHELLGVAASRANNVPQALYHLQKSRGERVAAEIAAIARSSVLNRSWTQARKAWTHLNALAMTTDQPLATSFTKLRDDILDVFVRVAMDEPGENIAEDPELARFVRDFAPRHPWLSARREHDQKVRLDASLRSALQKARDAKAAGNHEEVSLELEIMEGQEALSSDAVEVAELRAWAEERRALAQATRALSLAQSQDLDAACHAYVTASSRARDLVRAQGSQHLFVTLDQLNEVFPERANSRPILRAAAAWTQGHRLSDPTAAWSMLGPHVGLLEAVPTLAPLLNDVRDQARSTRAIAKARREQGSAGTHDICVEGVCFSEWSGPASDIRLTRIARQALRIGADSFVLSLGQAEDKAGWILSLWPCRPSVSPKHLRIREIDPGCALRIVAHKQRAVLWDEHESLWTVDFSGTTTVRQVMTSLPSMVGTNPTFVAVDDEHCAFRSGPDELDDAPLQIVHVPSGVVRTPLSGPRLYYLRTTQGVSFYRATGWCMERVSITNEVLDHFELPKNVSPCALVQIPGTVRPIVIASAIVRSCVLAWWQPQARFFRSFELFDENKHGELVEAWGLMDRGMFVLTQREDSVVFLHEATLEKGVLCPGNRRQTNFVGCSLVHDPSGRRAWVARSSKEKPMEIHDAAIWLARS